MVKPLTLGSPKLRGKIPSFSRHGGSDIVGVHLSPGCPETQKLADTELNPSPTNSELKTGPYAGGNQTQKMPQVGAAAKDEADRVRLSKGKSVLHV